MLGKDTEVIALQLRQVIQQPGTDHDALLIISSMLNDYPLAARKKRQLFEDLLALVKCHLEYHQDPTSADNFEKGAERCISIATLFAELTIKDEAYRLAEMAYNLKKSSDTPAYNIAFRIVEYANFDDPDQCALSLWIFAIEQVIHSVNNNCDWLKAFDATEIAMTVRVSDNQMHQILASQLAKALFHGSETPLRPLIYGLYVLGDLDMDDNERKEIFESLSGIKRETGDPEKDWEIVKWMAIMNIQMDIDNGRYEFLKKRLRPALAWHDFTLFHSHLEESVPFGKSLIVDVNRTGGFVLDLAHELTHAYSLIGSIGKSHNALRSVVNICEMLLISGNGQLKKGVFSAMKPVTELEEDDLTDAITRVQFSGAWKAVILEAVWRPWLEGVAMYFEMLCDPAQFPTEILPVHEAIRSLIDIDFQRKPEETKEQYTSRIKENAVNEFEGFFSEALKRFSRSRHTGYTYLPSEGAEHDKRDIYLMGYLLVRSMVSRWELTLCRRLEPIEAGKLLLHVTKGDANEKMVPDLTADAGKYPVLCRQHFIGWLHDIANFDKDTMESFLTTVDSDQPGRHYYWEKGKMYPDNSELSTGRAGMAEWVNNMKHQALGVLSGKGMSQDGLQVASLEVLKSIIDGSSDDLLTLIDNFWELQTLLPVGMTMAKINILNEKKGKIMLSPRSYIGATDNRHDDPQGRQRYSIQIYNMTGGSDEAAEVKRLLCKQRLARSQATRVIDLIGRSYGPLKGIASYKCFLIGKDWHNIGMFSGELEVTDKNKEFRDLIIERIYPSLSFEDEISTIASFNFLSRRLRKKMKDIQLPGIPWDATEMQISVEMAFEACMTAFGTSKESLIEALGSGKDEDISGIIGNYLFETGSAGCSGLWTELQETGAVEWTERFADSTAFSGIKPFKL